MKAMILAAGRGKRMGGLTDNCPKPLLRVGDSTLIEWQIVRLKNNGFTDIVINVGYLGQKIIDYLGNGQRYGVNISYSIEPKTGLETGGGVFNALPLLGDEPFLLTNADVFCDYPYRQLLENNLSLSKTKSELVHLVLVPNPEFKAKGDFSIADNRLLKGIDYTFAGISVISPQLFNVCQSGVFPIAPLFHQAIFDAQVTAELFEGLWCDVGTPERLSKINTNIIESNIKK